MAVSEHDLGSEQGREAEARHPQKPPAPARPGWLVSLTRRPPFTWSRKRQVRWSIAVLVLLLAYPVLGTLAIWTGVVEWALKSEDLRVQIENPGYTIWPGKIRMKHVRIAMNGTTQFILEGDDLVINVRLLELVKRRVHVSELAARNVLYQMRVQVKDTKGIEQRVAAYPPLDGLPGKNVLHEQTAKKTEENDSDWTVHVEGLDVAVRELWFFEYRYLGKGTLRGAFQVGPNLMEVTSAVQDLGPGELRFGPKDTVATELRGQISANIPRLNPKEHADASFMELVTARVNLRANVQSLSNMGAYSPGLEVSQGKGPLAVDLYLDQGRLGKKSHLDYETKAVRLKGDGFGVGSDLSVKFDAAGAEDQLPLLENRSSATYVSLARGMRSFTVQIHEHREEARLDTIQLSRSTDLKAASVRMPKIVSVDLQDLPVLLPEGAPVEVKSGEMNAALNLDMDEKYWARGALRTTLSGLEVDAAGVRVAGTLKLESQLRLNPKLKTYLAEPMAFTMRDMGMRAGKRTVSSWWLNLDSKRLAFTDANPSRFEGTVSVRARDLEPVLEGLAEKDEISELIPMLTSLRDFRAKAIIRTAGPITDVTLASDSTVWDAAGRVYKNGDKSRVALVIGGQAVSLGIETDGEHLGLMPFAQTGWLNERLSRFPKPLTRISGDAP